MERQHKIAFFIGIIAIMILDVCYVRTSLNQLFIFDYTFKFYKWFNCDYWYHIGLLLVFLSFILLMNGNKGYEKICKRLEAIEKFIYSKNKKEFVRS